MSQASATLRKVQGGYAHWCPGCEEMHFIATEEPRANGARWSFNGDVDRPTFSPSVKITSGHYAQGWQGKSCWCTYKTEEGEDPGFACGICHYFLRDGRIEFCADSTHALAGRTVDLPALPSAAQDNSD